MRTLVTVGGRALVLPLLALLPGCRSEEATLPQAAATSMMHFELPAKALAGSVIETAPIGPGELFRESTFHGAIELEPSRRASVSARVGGVLAETGAAPGSVVESGTKLTAIESRELAHLRSAVFEAQHRQEFARVTAEREQSLWERGITSEEDYLRAQHGREEARLGLEVARQELLAIENSPEWTAFLDALEEAPRRESRPDERADAEAAVAPDPDAWEAPSVGAPSGASLGAESLTRYVVRAPLGGVVMRRSGVRGGAVDPGDLLFEVANLEVLQVRAQVPAAELEDLRIGASVRVQNLGGTLEGDGRLSALGVNVDARRQLADIVIELPNSDGRWRPGLFVTVLLESERRTVALIAPADAVHQVRGERYVFVASDQPHEWEARRVTVADADAGATRAANGYEIQAGLLAGERVAVSHGFLLKSTWLARGGPEQ